MKRPQVDALTKCRLVAFDLGGVLVDVDMSAGRRQCAELGYAPAVFNAIEASGAKAAGDVGAADAAQMLERIRFFEPLAADLTLGDLHTIWGSTVRWRPFVPALLARLRLQTAVLSIIDPIHAKALGDLPGASPVVYSFRIGALKPDAAAYAALIAQSRLPPEVIRYMDDRPENVQAARKAGIDAFHATGLTDLEAGLKDVLAPPLP